MIPLSFAGGPFGGGGGMGIISSDSLEPGDIRRFQMAKREEELRKAADKKRKEERRKALALKDIERKKRFSRIEQTTEKLGRSFGQFGRVGVMQRPDLTQEQIAMQQMFGHGEKFWGANDPVHINHDLNPRQRGDFRTASLFGF